MFRSVDQNLRLLIPFCGSGVTGVSFVVGVIVVVLTSLGVAVDGVVIDLSVGMVSYRINKSYIVSGCSQCYITTQL